MEPIRNGEWVNRRNGARKDETENRGDGETELKLKEPGNRGDGEMEPIRNGEWVNRRN